MRFIIKYAVQHEAGNAALTDPAFGEKMKQLLTDLKAEAAYFSTINGKRGGYIVVNMDDVSQIPGMAEPFFLWMNADVEFIPVMTPEDLGQAGAGIGAAIKKWT